MRLASFHIKKYRSIEDSGEIRVDENVTTFVGINESGKTNVLRALKRLNPIEDTCFNDLAEQPTWHFESMDPEEVFVTATFKLSGKERDRVSEISGRLVQLDEVKFSRRKNMNLICDLEAEQEAIHFDAFDRNYLQPILAILNSVNPNAFERGQGQKDIIIGIFEDIVHGYEGKSNVRQPQTLASIKQRMKYFTHTLSVISGDHAKKASINSAIERIYSEVTEDPTEKIKEYLVKALPRFIYFANVAIIDSRIHLPTFVKKLDASGLSEDEKTAKTLLDLAGLDAKDLHKLSTDGNDRAEVRENHDRLDRLLSGASTKVSNEIDSIWDQNDHDIEFRVQGENFRAWVIDRKDKTKLQLEEGSRGYRWYFSFYVIFSAESKGRHKDAIILLDEPALYLHPKAQSDLLKNVLPKMAEKNQILYTTHSPFMVNLSDPASIHTVTLKDIELEGRAARKVTQISDKVWDDDRMALFPLQSALHYTMAQSMFIGKKNLIVEGVTDLWMLGAASALLESAGKTHLKQDFVLVPAGGATKSVFFASTYKSQGLDVAVLLDADPEGETAHDLLVKNKVLRGQKVVLINEMLGKNGNMSIEDVFPEDYYLKFVESAYQNELNEKKIERITLTSQDPMVLRRIEEFFREKGLPEFHKGRPARAILEEFGQADTNALPEVLICRLEKLFAGINKLMGG